MAVIMEMVWIRVVN